MRDPQIKSSDDWQLVVCALKNDKNCSTDQFIDALEACVKAAKQEALEGAMKGWINPVLLEGYVIKKSATLMVYSRRGPKYEIPVLIVPVKDMIPDASRAE